MFSKNFNEDGSLIFEVEAYFDKDDMLDPEIELVLDVEIHCNSFSPSSPAAAMYYAGQYSQKMGRTAYQLFMKCMY